MVRKATSPKKTATKASAASAGTAKAAPEAAAPQDAAPATVVRSMGKRELIDRVVTASGIKKKAAKPVVEAMLKELGDALSRGETLNLQPFGKGIVKNRKDLENAEIVELRLRRSKLALKAAEEMAGDGMQGSDDDDETHPARTPLAEAAE